MYPGFKPIASVSYRRDQGGGGQTVSNGFRRVGPTAVLSLTQILRSQQLSATSQRLSPSNW